MATRPAGEDSPQSQIPPSALAQEAAVHAGRQRGSGSEYELLVARCSRTRQELEGLAGRPIAPLRLLRRVKRVDKLAEDIGRLFRDLRLLLSTAEVVPAMGQLASQVPLDLLLGQKRAIEDCMKQARAQGGSASLIIRPPLLAFRAKADRLERRQQLISPPDSLSFQKAVRWAAERGGGEELHLLRQIKPALQEPTRDTLDLVKLAETLIDDRVKEQLALLAAALSHRQAPEAALRAVTKIGSRGAEMRLHGWALRDLRSEAFNPVPALFEVLTGAGHVALQAEAAWALGQFGGPEAARRLLLRLSEVWSDPSQPAEIRAALVAGLSQALDCYSLYQLATADPTPLRAFYRLLLEEAHQLNRLEIGFRVDLISTLVALETRSERVNVRLEAGSSLAYFLRPEAGPTTQAIAAVAALNELATIGDRQELWRWVQGEGELKERLRVWPDCLEKAAQRPFSDEELRRFLLASSRFDAIQEDVETSFRLLREKQGQNLAPSSSDSAR